MTNGKSNLLIDDYVKNIHEWEAKGGKEYIIQTPQTLLQN